MAGSNEASLSKRERQIMDVVYRLGEATATDVVREMADPPSRTAVRTLLRILEEKGHLQHRAEGQTYVYSPCHPREQVGRSAFHRVLDTFFDGSLEKAVAAHLGDEGTDLTPEELSRLVKLINQARKKGKES